MEDRDDLKISRRKFVILSVSIGGSLGLSGCIQMEDNIDLPTGPSDVSVLPERQHGWNQFLKKDDFGNDIQPRHHIILFLDYNNEGIPSNSDREYLEDIFKALERSYPRSNRGLLFTIGYSPYYFDRFEENISYLELPRPEGLSPFEDPNKDSPDAILHLASDFGSVIMSVDQALRGEKDELNGVEFGFNINNIFSIKERRTGFVGENLPAKNQDVEGIPDSKPVSEESPLFMGFKSGFKKNQASEDRITIKKGKFSEGTTQHLSKLTLNLKQWYEQDSRFQRVSKMFCPHHAENEKVEGVGENLGSSSHIDECGEDIIEEARNNGVVGHSQKMVDVRKNDEPLILRRDFNSTDNNKAGLHFLSLQRNIEDFIETRNSMNGVQLSEKSAVGQKNNNGLLQYITVERRGNYLLPPRSIRSLPAINNET